MLAQNFKSHTDLGISDKEHRALVKVLGMLERGELAHDPCCDQPVGPGFRMNGFLVENECGTVACIAGWVSVVLGETRLFAGKFAQRTEAISDLCCDPGIKLSLVTPAQAALALRSYLSTGEPRWNEAVEAV